MGIIMNFYCETYMAEEKILLKLKTVDTLLKDSKNFLGVLKLLINIKKDCINLNNAN